MQCSKTLGKAEIAHNKQFLFLTGFFYPTWGLPAMFLKFRIAGKLFQSEICYLGKSEVLQGFCLQDGVESASTNPNVDW